MLNKLRKIIREEIERLYQEMVERPDRHFEKREYERLYSSNTDFPRGDETFFEQVKKDILFLRDITVTFKGKLDIFKRAPMVFTHIDPDTGKRNQGNIIWFFTSNNELDSLVFADSERVSGLATLTIEIGQLKDYVNKTGKKVLDDQDLKELKKLVKKPQEAKPEKPKQNIVKINGTPYVVDKENSTLFKKNDPKVSYDVYEALEDEIEGLEIDSKTKDEILAYLM